MFVAGLAPNARKDKTRGTFSATVAASALRIFRDTRCRRHLATELPSGWKRITLDICESVCKDKEHGDVVVGLEKQWEKGAAVGGAKSRDGGRWRCRAVETG